MDDEGDPAGWSERVADCVARCHRSIAADSPAWGSAPPPLGHVAPSASPTDHAAAAPVAAGRVYSPVVGSFRRSDAPTCAVSGEDSDAESTALTRATAKLRCVSAWMESTGYPSWSRCALSIATIVVPLLLYTSGHGQAALWLLLLYLIACLGVVVVMACIMALSSPRSVSGQPHR